MTIVPRFVKRINKAHFNVLARTSPTGYTIVVLLAYCGIAGALHVSLVFAAFFAGFAVVHKKRRLFADALDSIGKVSFAFFIPVYFAIVGLQLNLIHGVSLRMRAAFIVGICALKVISVSLASVAFAAGIISPQFYTTLVVAAVLTSQIAGAWLDYVLRKGWPLLTPTAQAEAGEPSLERPRAA